MDIDATIKSRGMSRYSLSKLSGIPYATINDICNGKTNVNKCNARTALRIAHALGVTVEDLLATDKDRCDFELFKSAVCHDLKRYGDQKFVAKAYGSGEIYSYYNRSWYAECFYLLAMADYISRINGLPVWEEYDKLRKLKLSEIIYPTDVLVSCAVFKSDEPKKKALSEAIPEFLRHNIVEADVRNVV